MLTAYPAAARDQGIINQAGPAAATQKFYLHPALQPRTILLVKAPAGR